LFSALIIVSVEVYFIFKIIGETWKKEHKMAQFKPILISIFILPLAMLFANLVKDWVIYNMTIKVDLLTTTSNTTSVAGHLWGVVVYTILIFFILEFGYLSNKDN
jgi:hypothetical protein